MLRWSRLSLGLVAACLLLSPTAAHAQGKKKRPNIVYIMSDNHASAAISAYGSWLAKVNPTPNIDRLAKGGTRFTSALVTNSICTPSRAAILTGQYSQKNGVYTLNDTLEASRQTFIKLLHALGYQSAIIGKWHLGMDYLQANGSGFDYWNVYPGQGRYYDPILITKSGKTVHKGKYATDVVTDLSLDWLKKRDKNKPFILLCQYKAPHRPWDPAPRFKDRFKDVTIPEPKTLLDDYKNRSKSAANTTLVIGEHMNYKTDLGVEPPKGLDRDGLRKWAYQLYMKRYLSCVQAVDENVGRILDFLDKEGLSEDTIVIYTSDQGFFLGEHGYYDKRFMYEPSLTTPLIVRYPGHIKGGTVNNDMVLNIDYGPTILDYAGVKVPDDMQGKSFKSILEGKTPKDWRQSMYYRYWMHLAQHGVPAHYGVRTNRYTLIHFYGQPLDMKGAVKKPTEPEWELFDRQKDPEQMNNVYNHADYQPVVKELRAELERLRKEFKDER